MLVGTVDVGSRCFQTESKYMTVGSVTLAF